MALHEQIQAAADALCEPGQRARINGRPRPDAPAFEVEVEFLRGASVVDRFYAAAAPTEDDAARMVLNYLNHLLNAKE